MTHRSKKLLGRGNQQYFNEKRPVNLRVENTQLAPRLFCALEDPVADSELLLGSCRLDAYEHP